MTNHRLIGLFIAVMLAPTACAQTKVKASMPSIPCDVVNEDFCFGLSRGDSATLSIPVDFKLYKIELANGQKVTVYYGSQAEMPGEDHVPIFSQKAGRESVYLYARDDGDQKITDLYYEKRREKFTIFVHVNSSYQPDQSQAYRSFLGDFRKCNSARKDLIECTADRIFMEALDKL